MSEWKEYKFSDIAEVIGGGTPDTFNVSYWNGDIPWLSPKDLTGYSKIYISKGERNITSDGLKNSSAKLLPKDTVLLTTRAPIGYVAIAENEIATNQGFKNFVLKKDYADCKFVYYWLKNNIDYLRSIGTGTTFAEISGSVVKEIKILLPPLSEQKSIASILSSLDDKIDLLHRQNATLEKMAETLFRQWFIEDAKEEWECYKLKDLVKHVKPGTNFQPKRIEYGIPFLNVRNLNNGFIDLSDTTKISKEEYQRVHKNWEPEENDILISRIGTLGIVAVIQGSDLPVAVHYNMINLKAKTISYQFLYFLLKSQLFKEKYFSNVRQSVQEYVTIEDTENVEISLPIGTDLFKEHEIAFNELFNKIKSNQTQIRTLTALRDTLLPKLMSGEIRVL